MLVVAVGLAFLRGGTKAWQWVYMLYCFTPAVAVWIAEKNEGLGTILRQYKVSFKEIDLKRALIYVLGTAILLPVLHLLCIYGAGNLLHIGQFGQVVLPDGWLGRYLLDASIALAGGLTLNMLAALGGEIGWRGFLGRHLDMEPWKRNAITGLIWGTWYLPLTLIPRITAGEAAGHIAGAVVMTYLTFIVLSFILDRVFRASRSMFVPAAVYGIFITSSFMLHFQAGGDATFFGNYGVAGIISLGILYLVFKKCNTT